MKFHTSKSGFKGLVFASSFLLVVSMTGCNDKAEDKGVTKDDSQAALKIEVSQNENAREIKVQAKENDANQSKSYYYDYNIKSEYDPNAQPANESAGVRAKPRTAIDANMNVRSPYEKIQLSLLVNKLSKNFIVKCSACHNDYANGIIGPSLLTKDSDYIVNKITQYKNGEKTNVLMTDLVKMMSQEEIKQIADEIYEFNKQINELRK
jgi:cytochrome c553